MPNLSASDYTQYLKFKAAAASPIAPAIQTRSNATLSQSVLNANILASQAAFATTPPGSIPFRVVPTISAVSSQTVTEATPFVVSGAVGNGTLTTYTTSQPHGLATGAVVSILGFTVVTDVNVTNGIVTSVSPTQFTIPTVANGTATGTGRIVGRVYYTTSVSHGLVAGQNVSITGITTFTATNAVVLAATAASTFVLASTTTGTGVTGQTGTIAGFAYYTTSAAHGLSLTRSDQFVTISGITSVTAFNVEKGSVISTPSATVFVLANTTVGAVTSQTGIVVLTTLTNLNMSFLGNARIVSQPTNNVNNPNALSTVSYSTSGATSSSKFQQPGGLPAKNVVGTYHRIPQQAGWN